MSFSNFQLSGGRKLLGSPPTPSPREQKSSGWSSTPFERHTLNSDVAVILAAMVCALICALGLNSLLKCARCYRRRMAGQISDAVGNTGMKKAAMKALPIIIYTSPSKLPPGSSTDCAICLAEFGAGERVRVLPNCNHGFHMECIDEWLASHTSCPICRHSLYLINRNRKPEGAAAISQATESNNAIHVVIESTDSTPDAEVPERTLQEATGVTNSSPLPPAFVSENESSSHPIYNVA